MCTLFHLPKVSWSLSNRSFPVLTVLSRVDDRCVASGIIYVIKHGLQWQDAPDELAHNAVQPLCQVEQARCFQ